MIIFVYSLNSVFTKFHLKLAFASMSYMPIYVPIVMYGLRLFIVVLQELPNCLHVSIIRVIGIYHLAKFRSSTPSSF